MPGLLPLTATALFAAAFFTSAPAFAHAFLDRSSPPVGGVVAAPPAVSISFTEAVEPAFSTIEVQGADGAAVGAGKAHAAAGNGRQLIVELPKLAPGKYTVIWHVTSVDTHKTQGKFEFTVSP